MQELDPHLLKLKERVLEGKEAEFSVSTDGILHYKGRLCIPDDVEIREQLLSEAHATPYSVHPGATKMYQDLKERFWWSGTWNRYLPLIEFSYNNSYQATIGMAPYEALYGRKCRSPVHWYETGETEVTTPEFVEDTTQAVKKIQARMKSAQRSHTVRKTGKVKSSKYVSDKSHVLEQEPIEIHEDLSFEEKPVRILDHKIKTLRNKEIPLVKVLWRNQKMEEATWEREDEMKASYPELF
ncbi:hypothetical protein UlMin_022265 [Ulmus minor]